MHTWTMDEGWGVFHIYQNHAAALIQPFIFFIFLSLQFSDLKNFVALPSGIVSPRKLKLGTHMNNGWMYHVYSNQAAAAYSSLFSFFFLQFSKIKIFHHTFLGNSGVRLGPGNREK